MMACRLVSIDALKLEPQIFLKLSSFLDLFIGLIYCCITIFFLIILGCVALPFNLIFSL